VSGVTFFVTVCYGIGGWTPTDTISVNSSAGRKAMLDPPWVDLSEFEHAKVTSPADRR
jgi:hypothetical protein